MIGLERNQQHADVEQRSRLKIRFLKYRLVGASANGKTFDVMYDHEQGRFTDVINDSEHFGEVLDEQKGTY
jgi:hypothetical protein